MKDHTCEGRPEDALIAHPWRFHEEWGSWVRDDCVENGCAYAASINQTLDGLRWTGPEGGPWSKGPFYDTVEMAMIAYDLKLMQAGWTLL